MSRGGKKNSKIQNKIVELELRKRNGLMRAVAAFVGLFIIISIKIWLSSQGIEWADSPYANMSLFVLAAIAAGIAGMGTRAWTKARKEIAYWQSKMK